MKVGASAVKIPWITQNSFLGSRMVGTSPGKQSDGTQRQPGSCMHPVIVSMSLPDIGCRSNPQFSMSESCLRGHWLIGKNINRAGGAMDECLKIYRAFVGGSIGNLLVVVLERPTKTALRYHNLRSMLAPLRPVFDSVRTLQKLEAHC